MRKSRIVPWLIGFVLVLAAGFYAGPRVDVSFHARPILLPADLDSFLAKSERAHPEIVPGAERTIIWANPAKTKTPLAFVYLHGFSATRQEISPVCERVAAHFGANLYFARFTGHGLDGAALGAASVDDWLNDTLEAMAIGRRLGERVIVIATSTGATLATWVALHEQSPETTYIFISPNFGLKNRNAGFLTWPWARWFVPKFFGAERHRAPQSEIERRYWTDVYPTAALFPMAGVVDLVNRSNLEAIRQPLLVIYSPQDDVADPQKTEQAYTRFGAKKKQLFPFIENASRNHHVLAGDIIAPANTDRMVATITAFVSDVAGSATVAGKDHSK